MSKLLGEALDKPQTGNLCKISAQPHFKPMPTPRGDFGDFDLPISPHGTSRLGSRK